MSPPNPPYRPAKRDVALWLAARGQMPRECLDAALELRSIWLALGRGLSTPARDLSVAAIARSAHGYRDPFDRCSRRELRLYDDHYRPWADRLRGRSVGRPPLALITFVHAVVERNQTIREAIVGRMVRTGHARQRLVGALRLYCEVAGWLAAPTSTKLTH